MGGENENIWEYAGPKFTLSVDTVSVEETNDTIMAGSQCLNSFL